MPTHQVVAAQERNGRRLGEDDIFAHDGVQVAVEGRHELDRVDDLLAHLLMLLGDVLYHIRVILGLRHLDGILAQCWRLSWPLRGLRGPLPTARVVGSIVGDELCLELVLEGRRNAGTEPSCHDGGPNWQGVVCKGLRQLVIILAVSRLHEDLGRLRHDR